MLEEGAALEEELGDLEMRLRDFGGELDVLLHGVGAGGLGAVPLPPRRPQDSEKGCEP